MPERIRERLAMLNAFVHDVATGTWISCVFLLALLDAETRSPEWRVAAHLLPALERKFMAVTWASLAVILATGVVRWLTFRLFGFTGDVARERIRLLKIKHALLGAVFAAGTAWLAYRVYG